VAQGGPLGGGNVSSGQLDQAEVDGVAKELKKGLGDNHPSTTPPIINQAEGVLHVQSSRSKDQADDTIAIDNEGRLQLREPTAGAGQKE
jgi:hypothetical protein